ncbi:MAG: hypothetical protein QSU88_07870, partial [Candidatus Methanoperedens sp.]|nr:hypothetical protein [Candidatus Methanoperedens sp.]
MISPKKCPLCNNFTFYLITFTKDCERQGKRIYFHCHKCDLIFVPEQFHLSPPDEEERYLLHNNTLSNEGYV